jgi:RNA polymerase sigma-70 factor (ECF subfamily)
MVCATNQLETLSLHRSAGARPRPRALLKIAVRTRAPKKRFDEMNDVELLAHVIEGHDRAWNVFFKRFRSLILSCALKAAARAGSPLGADDLMDVLGDVTLNMIAHDFRRLRLYRIDGGCSVATWVGVIATSTTRDFLRRARRHRLEPTAEAELEQFPSPEHGPEDALVDRQRRTFVDRALAQLSRRDQRFVQLYFQEAMPPEEIASQMGVSVSTVYSKKAKIKSRLMGLAAAV